MFNVGALSIPFDMIAKSKTAIVTNVADWFDYVDGKRTQKQLGFGYDCVLKSNGYQQIRIKVQEEKPSFTNEVITASGGEIEIEPQGFTGRIYVANNRADLSCKAKAVVPVAKKPQ